MAADLNSYDHTDEEYIDMEVSSNSNFLSHPTNSPPHAREFEFQMFSSSSERETTTSPADELFYKGKLLPLHLPPRLQMVEKLLQNSNSYNHNTTDSFEEYFTTPLTTSTTYTTPTANTPFQSCNISPSESFHMSQELNPNEYFSEFSTEESNSINEVPKKSWTRKLKLIKQSLKSFFNKSRCSEEGTVPRAKEYQKIQNKNTKSERKPPFGQIQREKYHNSNTISRSFNKEKIAPDSGGVRHRRSFSGAIKRLSMTKCYSSSSSTSSSSSLGNSNGSHESRFLKRSSSVSSDMENSIQGAIAHCKRSQEELHSRKTVSEVPFYSLSASRVVYEDQERPGPCRD
ncbi:hypothetical protein RHSIM_RhsimUnG0167900 [Rhododendron simsii]|uniref:Membrane-associated kinase regulator 4 n=1 Tax=Rhododendron simsii TaxID=118357 RepID=A0A834FZR0_RHOSS|nr:hypothetical protein RHSIM_RhsimUnG0167900 [Rhododendron simsii]